jgi:hypothetical protein
MHVKDMAEATQRRRKKKKEKKLHTNEPSATLTHIATCITGYSVQTQVAV